MASFLRACARCARLTRSMEDPGEGFIYCDECTPIVEAQAREMVAISEFGGSDAGSVDDLDGTETHHKGKGKGK